MFGFEIFYGERSHSTVLINTSCKIHLKLYNSKAQVTFVGGNF